MSSVVDITALQESANRICEYFEDALKAIISRQETFPANFLKLRRSPPSYTDLGKQARDVFNKGYDFGIWKLDCRTKSCVDVEFSTCCSNQETGKAFGSMETKYNLPEYGLNLAYSEKWDTESTVFINVTHTEKRIKGLIIAFEGSIARRSENVNGKVKVSYGQDLFQLDYDTNLGSADPVVIASAVVGVEGWLAGFQTAFDTTKIESVNNSFALGYTNEVIAVTANVNYGQEFSSSIFRQINSNLSCGVRLSWASGSNAKRYGIAAKCHLNDYETVRAKVNNASQIGLGYQRKISDGITLNLSTLFHGKNFAQIGLALKLEI